VGHDRNFEERLCRISSCTPRSHCSQQISEHVRRDVSCQNTGIVVLHSEPAKQGRADGFADRFWRMAQCGDTACAIPARRNGIPDPHTPMGAHGVSEIGIMFPTSAVVEKRLMTLAGRIDGL